MVDPIPIRGNSMHDGVAAKLRDMVFERELDAGTFIDELALAAKFQISRTPLREALKVLAAEGLVESVPRRGSRVIAMTDADAEQLFPVMALLEGRCAHEAAMRASDDALLHLQRLHDQLERTAAVHDLDGYYRVNHEFHSAVQSMAANRWLDRVSADLRRFMRLWRGRQLKLPGRIEASIQEHRDLLAAIVERDPARAERAMHEHLMAQSRALAALQRLESAESPPAQTDAQPSRDARQRQA